MRLNLRLIIYVDSLIATFLGLLMLIPALIDRNMNATSSTAFLSAAVITLVISSILLIATRNSKLVISTRGTFILTVSLWFIATCVAALPFLFFDYSITNAYFESVSGLTTTGSTIITNLDSQPLGLLLWRALLQWLGGIGIIVTAMAVLPMLKIGGMQLFNLESSDTSEKVMHRTRQIALAVAGLYLFLTFLCFLSYLAIEMSLFDAICHAMTTIATGGFSTSDLSMGKFIDQGGDLVAILFMILGSLPFALYILLLRGDWRSLWRDEQVRIFFVTLLFFSALIFFILMSTDITLNQSAWRASLFNVTSIMTGTGYASQSYDLWGPVAITVFMVLIFVGGCAGSTSCGIKIFRHLIAAKAIWAYAKSMIRPHTVNRVRYNRKVVDSEALDSILSFYFIFVLLVIIFGAILSVSGLDFLTAMSASATSFANVGPGLGKMIGPSGTFSELSDGVKWILCLAMLIGRLEIFTVIVLFTPEFWQNQ